MKLFALIAAIAAMVSPKETVSDFLARASASRISFGYSYSTLNRTPKMTGSGDVTVQGEAFFMSGDGLEVVCDGRTRWTVDRSAAEAIVETVADGEDFSANPALFLARAGKACVLKEASRVSRSGKDMVEAVLEPSAKSNVRKIVLYIIPGIKDGDGGQGQALAEAEVTVSDGTITLFTVNDFTLSPISDDLAVFTLDPASLPTGTVVTDLR